MPMEQVSFQNQEGLNRRCRVFGLRWKTSVNVCVFQDFYDEQGVFSESFWPQSEPPQAMAFNPRARVNKPLTPPPPTTQSINNQVGAAALFHTLGLIQNRFYCGFVASLRSLSFTLQDEPQFLCCSDPTFSAPAAGQLKSSCPDNGLHCQVF